MNLALRWAEPERLKRPIMALCAGPGPGGSAAASEHQTRSYWYGVTVRVVNVLPIETGLALLLEIMIRRPSLKSKLYDQLTSTFLVGCPCSSGAPSGVHAFLVALNFHS